MGTAYLASDGFLAELLDEIGGVETVVGRLAITSAPPRWAAWAQCIWYDPVIMTVASIKQGVRALRAIQRNWVLYPARHVGRARLIQAGLPHVSARPLQFPDPAPAAALGSWTLLAPGTILAAPVCSSPFPLGAPRFVEDRAAPPNRAYLKLWEAFTLLGRRPGPGARCLDLGASPGGWTWVLQRLGATVTSVDKAPLASSVTGLPGVTTLRESAFALDPKRVGAVEWLCCDVVCYPERLLGLVLRWLDAGLVGTAICSVKFQGPTDHAIARRFADIPGSRLLHLHHNKHELTWIWPWPTGQTALDEPPVGHDVASRQGETKHDIAL